MWLNLTVSTQAHTPLNKVRNGGQAYLHLARHSSGSDWTHR